MKFDDLTIRQINAMAHAIGFSRDKVKRNKYTAYRNYYTTSNINDLWEDLVKRGLAKSDDFEMGVGTKPMIYWLTNEGIEILASFYGVKIMLDED